MADVSWVLVRESMLWEEMLLRLELPMDQTRAQTPVLVPALTTMA